MNSAHIQVGPDLRAGRSEDGARDAEAAFVASGADWTILRSAFFFQNFTEAYWAASLDLIDGRLLAGDLAGALQRLDATSELDRWEGTMAWHQRQRLGLLRARAALTAGDRDTALGLAEAVRADAAGRGSRRYELLAAAWVARAERQPDREAVNRIVDGLEACARLEGWRLAAELAAQLGVDQWRVAAERMASSIVAASGEHRDVANDWFDRLLTPASPM